MSITIEFGKKRKEQNTINFYDISTRVKADSLVIEKLTEENENLKYRIEELEAELSGVVNEKEELKEELSLNKELKDIVLSCTTIEGVKQSVKEQKKVVDDAFDAKNYPAELHNRRLLSNLKIFEAWLRTVTNQ